MSTRIDDFKTALVGGGARANYFRVIPQFPQTAVATAQAAQAEGTQSPLGFNELGSFMIKAAQMPASTINPIEVDFRGRKLKVAGDRTFEDWQLTVINDTNFAVRNAFEAWMNQINTHVSGESPIGTNLSDYIQDWKIEQLNKNGGVVKTYDMRGCWPTTLDTIDVSFESVDTIEEFTVTLAYQYWTANTTDNIG